MTRQRWLWIVTAVMAWVCLVTSVADAAGLISKVGGGGTVTLSVFQRNADGTFSDITDTYLPTWAPPPATLQTVYIVVNGTGTPSLVPPTITAPAPYPGNPNPYLAETTTSKFPGNCTNFGTDPGPDFTFSTTTGLVSISGKTGYPLTANDCGGMAVLSVGADKFIVPKDAGSAGNPTGIPNAVNVFGVALTPGGDPDGDGFSTFDETVRGFIIGGQHVRLNPTVKDLFVYLVRGQCGTSVLRPTGSFPVTGAGGLDANLNTLIRTAAPLPAPGIANLVTTQVHFLGNSLSPSTPTVQTNEWIDYFSTFTLGGGTTETWTYCPTPNAGASCTGPTVVTASKTTPAAPSNDRVVTKNRVYGSADQKGLRITECATTSGTSPQGTGRYGVGAANGSDEAVVYTDRIRRTVNSTGTSRADIYYSTFQNSAWTPLNKQNSSTVTFQQARDFITSKIIQYTIAMEVGHTLMLIDQALLTSVPTFPHYAAGSGDNMDEGVQIVTSGTPSGIKFYVPSSFQSGSQGAFQLTAPASTTIP